MNLYTFVDEDNHERFTTAKSNVTVNGVTYEPRTIQRTRYSLDSLVKKNNITITFAGNDEFALQYIHPTTLNLTVVIATLTGMIFYRGRLVTVRYHQNKIDMVFEQLVRLGSNYSGDRRLYQRACPYQLYGSNCQAQEIKHDLTFVSAKSTTVLRARYVTFDTSDLTGDEAFAVLRTYANPNAKIGIGRLAGGLLYISNSTYWITKISNPQATLRAVGDPSAPQAVKAVDFDITTFRAYADTIQDAQTLIDNPMLLASFGCLRTTNDCRALHDNIENYGGFAGLTKVSPFKGGLRGS